MDLKKLRTNASAFFKKNKYVALILLIGIVLMLIPARNSQEQTDTSKAVTQTNVNSPSLNESLASILCRIEGAGDVQVLLTLAAGEETIYQTDVHSSTSDDANTTQIDTIILSSTDRAERGLIRQTNPPTYLGAIVVCEGADSAAIRLAIVDAVSKVTGLGADRISVLKMK